MSRVTALVRLANKITQKPNRRYFENTVNAIDAVGEEWYEEARSKSTGHRQG
jgi:hypothetical protein